MGHRRSLDKRLHQFEYISQVQCRVLFAMDHQQNSQYQHLPSDRHPYHAQSQSPTAPPAQVPSTPLQPQGRDSRRGATPGQNRSRTRQAWQAVFADHASEP